MELISADFYYLLLQLFIYFIHPLPFFNLWSTFNQNSHHMYLFFSRFSFFALHYYNSHGEKWNSHVLLHWTLVIFLLFHHFSLGTWRSCDCMHLVYITNVCVVLVEWIWIDIFVGIQMKRLDTRSYSYTATNTSTTTHWKSPNKLP